MLFLFNCTANNDIYTLSLHDALPIFRGVGPLDDLTSVFVPALSVELRIVLDHLLVDFHGEREERPHRDRKSTRLNSSHGYNSYAVFCLKIIITLIHKSPLL